MSKEETKKTNDPVGEYLVNKIKELENERERILKHMDLLEEKASKYEEIQSLFKLECGMVCLYDRGGHFQNAITIDTNEFGKYLVKLLDLKEKE